MNVKEKRNVQEYLEVTADKGGEGGGSAVQFSVDREILYPLKGWQPTGPATLPSHVIVVLQTGHSRRLGLINPERLALPSQNGEKLGSLAKRVWLDRLTSRKLGLNNLCVEWLSAYAEGTITRRSFQKLRLVHQH